MGTAFDVNAVKKYDLFSIGMGRAVAAGEEPVASMVEPVETGFKLWALKTAMKTMEKRLHFFECFI